MDVPQGWKVEKASSFNCILQPEVEPESEVKSLEGWYIDITVWNTNDFTLKETVDNCKDVHEGGKKMEPLTFSGIKFEHFYFLLIDSLLDRRDFRLSWDAVTITPHVCGFAFMTLDFSLSRVILEMEL